MPVVGKVPTAELKRRLSDVLRRFDTLGVALSGGVDSALLLAVAYEVMGNRVVAMTAKSATHPMSETRGAEDIARWLGVRHLLFNSREMISSLFTANRPDRCYHCKRMLFEAMRRCADREQIRVLAHGANLDDLSDYRPGFKAADEMGISAPLVDAKLTKADIRRLAREMELPNWDRPAMACLATRIPYGVHIDVELLNRIEKAEALLHQLGVTSCRVRHHDALARIEVSPDEMTLLLRPGTREQVVGGLRSLGYHHVALDLEGYVSGKMNRGMDE